MICYLNIDMRGSDLWLLFICLISQSYGQHNPNFEGNRTVIVELFHWKFTDIAIECEQFLGPLYFGAVQISPITENLRMPGNPWFERYQPMSYIIMSRSGNETEFIDMTRRCNAVGVRVFVDVVLNHMAAPLPDNSDMIGTAGSVAYNRVYPSVPYNASDFHRPCSIDHYFDAHMVRNCDLFGLPDLDQSHSEVRAKMIMFLNRLIAMGVAGFRVGACKHMWPNDLKQIYAEIQNVSTEHGLPVDRRPFIYQDVFDIGHEPLSKTEYNFLGVVTEFMYTMIAGKIFNGILTLEAVRDWGPNMGLLQSEDALIFIDNHDLQRKEFPEDWTVSFRQPKRLAIATAFMLALPYGIPSVMSSYQFATNDQGPPTDESGEISSPHASEALPMLGDRIPECYNGWICEHRWHLVLKFIAFRMETTGSPQRRWQRFSEHKIAFCRGHVGLVAMNIDANSDFNEIVFACVPPGAYCDIVAGNDAQGVCKNIVIVGEDQRAHIHIPINSEYGMVALSISSQI